MKRFYLTTSYARRADMVKAAEDLGALGGIVTATWIGGSHELKDGDTSRNAELAVEGVADIDRADTFIAFVDRACAWPTRGGQHVEFGIALMLTKRLLLVGHRVNVFHWLPEVLHFQTWQECLNYVKADINGGT